jgi:hypothetical protein
MAQAHPIDHVYTLTGRLGADLEIRELPAQRRLVTRTVPDAEPPRHLAKRYAALYAQLPTITEEHEIERPARRIGKLSLAVPVRTADGLHKTKWVRVVIENIDALEHRGVRLFARKGTAVELQGRLRVTTFTGRDGQAKELRELVLTAFHLAQPLRARQID